MGHAEDLLAAAKRCIYEKGFARTTARDLVEESGTNLASIGYHYGSKDALLHAALMDAMDEWGDELERLLPVPGEGPADPVQRAEQTWERVIGLFATHRPLWIAQFEAAPQIARVPELRAAFAELQDEAHLALGLLIHGDEGLDDDTLRALGTFHQALLIGLMMQWLTDPDTAPSAHDLATALRLTAGAPQRARTTG